MANRLGESPAERISKAEGMLERVRDAKTVYELDKALREARDGRPSMHGSVRQELAAAGTDFGALDPNGKGDPARGEAHYNATLHTGYLRLARSYYAQMQASDDVWTNKNTLLQLAMREGGITLEELDPKRNAADTQRQIDLAHVRQDQSLSRDAVQQFHTVRDAFRNVSPEDVVLFAYGVKDGQYPDRMNAANFIRDLGINPDTNGNGKVEHQEVAKILDGLDDKTVASILAQRNDWKLTVAEVEADRRHAPAATPPAEDRGQTAHRK